MFPNLSMANTANCCLAYFPNFRQFPESASFHSVDSNLLNIPFIKLSRYAFTSFIYNSPSFIDGINVIISPCSKEQMIRIATRWIIALMECIQSIFNWSICKLPCYSGCQPGLVIDTEHSITLRRCASSPNPTIIWSRLFNLCPKSHFDWKTLISPREFCHHFIMFYRTSLTGTKSLLSPFRSKHFGCIIKRIHCMNDALAVEPCQTK